MSTRSKRNIRATSNRYSTKRRKQNNEEVSRQEDDEEEKNSTDFFDASAYGFDDNEQEEESNPLSWSLDNDDGLSDWKISVSSVNGDDDNEQTDTVTYYVHKNILGAGSNKSEYFVKLFKGKNNVRELSTATTVLKLEKSSCEAFPNMLDFLYSHDGRTEIHTQNVVALRHLAHYFSIRHLFMMTTDFIGTDFVENISKAGPLYLSEAARYHDERLANSAANTCAENMDSIKPSDFVVLSPDLAVKIFQSADLNGSSQHLSCIAAVYCEAHEGEIDEDAFKALTNDKIMKDISSNAAVSLLKSLVDINCHNPNAKEWKSLKSRCKKALIESWEEVIVNAASVPRGRIIKAKSRNEINVVSHRLLPHDQQAELLEDSVVKAKKDLKEIRHGYENEIKDLKRNLQRKELELQDFNDLKRTLQRKELELQNFNNLKRTLQTKELELQRKVVELQNFDDLKRTLQTKELELQKFVAYNGMYTQQTHSYPYGSTYQNGTFYLKRA